MDGKAAEGRRLVAPESAKAEVQDAGANLGDFRQREASRSAPVLWRFLERRARSDAPYQHNLFGRMTGVRQKAGQFCPAFAVTRFIRLHQGAQKGDAVNLWSAVRAAPQAKPLCQP